MRFLPETFFAVSGVKVAPFLSGPGSYFSAVVCGISWLILIPDPLGLVFRTMIILMGFSYLWKLFDPPLSSSSVFSGLT